MAKKRTRQRTAKVEKARSNPRPSYMGRRRFVVAALTLFGFALLWHAVDQQLFQGDFLRQEGRARHLRVMEMPASRGMITDRYGEPLAISTPVDAVWADPGVISMDDRERTSLAKVLKMKPAALTKLLQRHHGKAFVYLRRRVNPDVAGAVKALNLPGIGLRREYRRFYPSGEVSTHVVGFTNVDDSGQEGLELAYQDWLQARPGSKRVLKDGHARVVQDVESIRQPRAGQDLSLSLDRRLQYLAYRELKAAVAKHRAVAGSAVVLDARSGEILAMVNRPSYNPNGPRKDAKGGRLRNRVVTDIFEPGSTIKPFTVAVALETGRFRSTTKVDTSPGVLRVGSELVRDIRNYGLIDVASVIRKSSNVGASRIALDTDPETLWHLFRNFGFGSVTQLGFPGEISGRLHHFDGWSKFEQATLAFGYGMSVTPLQLAKAYSVLAADGVSRPLSVIRLDEAPAGKRVISKNTALAVREMLETVVSTEGTAPLAAVPGYRVAGKTGTVRKSISGGYAKDRYIALFAGIVPASDPRLVMVVMIDEPRAGKYYGGQVAAPVFSKIMAGALRLLNIPPDDYGPDGLRLALTGTHP